MSLFNRLLARGVAPVIRRNILVCIWASLAVLGLVVLFILLRWHFNWTETAALRLIPVVLALLPAAVIFPIGVLLRRNLQREWTASGGRLCTRCGYNLASLDPAGACPECGGAYDVAADRVVWMRSGMPPVEHRQS